MMMGVAVTTDSDVVAMSHVIRNVCMKINGQMQRVTKVFLKERVLEELRLTPKLLEHGTHLSGAVSSYLKKKFLNFFLLWLFLRFSSLSGNDHHRPAEGSNFKKYIKAVQTAQKEQKNLEPTLEQVCFSSLYRTFQELNFWLVTHQVTEILLRQIWGVQPTREQIEAVVRQVQGEKYMLKIKHIVLCVSLSHMFSHRG